MSKEFGSLSKTQFQNLIARLPEVKGQRDEMASMLHNMSEAKFDALMGEDFSWGGIYELSFVEHLAVVFTGFGRTEWLTAAAAAPDPQQRVLDAMDEDDDGPDELPPGVEKGHVVALVFSLQRTVLSIQLYQRSLSALVKDVRETGNLDSLFKVIRVDRAAMSCPSIAQHIARAELRGDKRFFTRLRNALKGPIRKHWEGMADLRYSLVVLRELGFDKLTDNQLEQLLVHDLKVYPNTPTARKNLRAQYQQSRKLGTI
ncbi:hypothetical protein [Thiomonas sp. FB-6]|uniref:hypothetical protein n=1 Tax=Thiomonas sp. FB-6 TaxID=1158291 RepID=UPI0012DF85A9|nr:hypothetical protein [Thiomonas sp. FB-6]